MVNHLATQALLEGMARGARQVDVPVVEAVAAERDFEGASSGGERVGTWVEWRTRGSGPGAGRRPSRHAPDAAVAAEPDIVFPSEAQEPAAGAPEAEPAARRPPRAP